MEPSEYSEMYEEGLADTEADDANDVAGRARTGPANAGPRPHAQVHLLSPTDKCKVCNEPAAKHVHYGAMTCFSCRAFFRRSIQNKTAATYVCRRSRNCEINLRTRRNCQFCRYNKCLSAGMKPSWVLSEDERHRRFKRNRERAASQNETEHVSQVSRVPQSSHKHETSLSQPDPVPMECVDDSILLVGQQQSQPMLVVKQEQVPDVRCHVEQKPIATSFQQYLVKTESGESRYLLAPVTSNQSAILVYTTNSLPQQQQAQNLSSTAVIVPSTTSLSSSNTLKLAPPDASISKNVSAAGKDQVQCGSGSVSTIKSGMGKVITKNPQQQNYGAAPVSSVIVQPSHRQQNMSNFQALQQATNYFLKQETAQSSADAKNNFKPAEIIVVASSSTRAPQAASSLQQATAVSAGANVTLSKIPSVSMTPITASAAAVTSAQEQWDSDYENDTFSSDEEDAMRPSINNEPEVKFCEDEWYQMEKMVKEHELKYRSVNFGEELIKEMIMCSMFGLPLSTSAAINGYRLTVERITRIAHNLELFTDLSKGDQSTLLMENADLLVSLRGAIFFDTRNKGVSQILISMGIDDMDTIKSIYTPLLKENTMKHIEYQTFNSIQTVANSSVETRYTALQTRVASLLSNDDIIVVLITYIILFNVDFCSLIDKRRVEQIQERYIRMLNRYIYSQYPRRIARLKLANTLGMITNLREMADIKKMRKLNYNVKMP